MLRHSRIGAMVSLDGDLAVCGAPEMAKSRNETTSPRAASAASKVLSNPRSSAAAKTAAASALTQARNKPM